MSALLAGVCVAALVLTLGSAPPARRWPGPAPAARRPLVAAIVGAWGTQILERARPQHRWRRRDAQLPDALDRLASALRAGQAIAPGVRELATTTPAPLGAELRAVALALDRGEPVTAALGAWGGGPGASADVQLVVAALALGASAGGAVARAVDRVAATLRERREVEAEVRALATQARASAGVLAVAPIVFAALVTTIEPGAVAFLVASPVGLACLVTGLGLEALGAVWMARITGSAS